MDKPEKYSLFAGLTEDDKQDAPIEELFQEVDEILTEMKMTDVSMNESFALFAKGMYKIKLCSEKINLIEQEIEKIKHEGSIGPFED